MQQKEILAGFSDLKDILIRTYKIERPRNQIRLHFTSMDGRLWLHDYADHNKKILLLRTGDVQLKADSFGWRLINFSKKSEKPAVLLNDLFRLYGFFRF